MPNPFIGYDNPYYDDHDLDVDANVDEEWFQHEHLKKKKKKKGPRYVLKHLGLIHACQEHLLSLQKLIWKQLCLQPGPYHLMQSWL